MKHTILVVDDEFDNRDILSEVFVDEGFEVIAAANAEEGFHCACSKQPSLILLDCKMPNSSTDTVLNARAGLELTKRIRGTPAITNIPIIVLSGFDAGEIRQELLGAGCNAVASKPYDFAALLTLVDNILPTS